MNKQVADQQNKTLINYVDQLVKMDEKLNDESIIGGRFETQPIRVRYFVHVTRLDQSACVIFGSGQRLH